MVFACANRYGCGAGIIFMEVSFGDQNYTTE